ncbi:hypothetical protein HWB57_gp078 [Erwinia phage vB_EamM-Bue1]|uniref:Uncharacterized protein n=1 Tax=Erwinia phage vB_EamM-Bue1 TaxID=2099338 RepID=A0A2P1JU88_9CAUD|nr:hypothetical protein HWB57_gp078 [Erwinia phage vB_EamM-Bue1]AVO22918.1 hypothetical protein [Erwinia phage vB_EamM-Bue1]
MTPSFSGFLTEQEDQKLVTEAFNTAPYDLTFGKKSAGDIFFTFHDEDDKEFRIQFYTPAGLGKNVRQVFIGQKKGASYLDSNQVFKNPMKVVASMIEATKQFLETPIGKGIDGFAINFSKKVMDRGLKLLPKIIRQSGLKQKLNVMDLTFSPDDGRGYVWVIRKGKDPADVFNGPKMKGVTWDDPNKVGDVPVSSGVGVNTPEQSNELTESKWLALLNFVGYSKAAGGKLFGNDEFIKNFVTDRYKLTLSITRRVQSVRLSVNAWDSGAEKWLSFPPAAGVLEYVDINEPKRFPKIIDDFVKDTMNYVEKNLVHTAIGWSNKTAPAGQPILEFRDNSGMYGGGINVVPSSNKPVYGMYYGVSSKSRTFAEVSDSELDALAKKIKLPPIPANVKATMTRAAEAWWASKNLTVGGSSIDLGSQIKRGSNDLVVVSERNSATVLGITFRKFGSEIDGYTIDKLLTYNERKNEVDITTNVINDKGSRLSTASYSVPYEEGVVQKIYKEMNEKLQSATGQLSLIDNDNYNPLKLKVGVVEIGSYGEIRVDGTDLGQASNRGFVLNRILKLTKDEEKRQKEQKNATNTPAPLSQNDWNGFKTTLEGMGFEIRTEFRKIFGAMPAGQGKLMISVSRLETGARVLGTLLDSNNFADNAWMKYARDADVVVSSADELKDAVKKIIDFKDQIVGNANPVAVPNQDQEMTTDRWRALCNALTKVKDFRGVTSSTTVSGGVSVGNKGRVQVTMMRGDGKTDDLVKVIIRANDTDSQSIDISPQIVLRGFPLNKPAQLTKDVQTAVNTKIAEINKAAPDSAALDNKAMLKNIETKKSSGRDVEWQIREYQGKIYADWDITFRRNSKTGAFMEYKTEISRANAAINYMKATLENAGYNVQTFILGLDDVRNMDATSDQAYSEYEQSIGGNLVATK